MKRLIIFTTLLIGIVTACAENLPRAFMKAQYEEWYKHYENKDTCVLTDRNKYMLQIANGMSYYYDPMTFHVDSIESTPEGRAMTGEILFKLIQESLNGSEVNPFAKMKEMGLGRGRNYRARKDFGTGKITVWDSWMGDFHRYDVEMSDLAWEVGDSTKNILGYECVNATADYHGRKWEAWFTPEIAVQEGPWQLCGLPGLIMEANSLDGEYGFVISGIEQCDEALKETFETDKYFNSKRKAFLKAKSYNRDHMSEQISAMTGGKVKAKIEKPKKRIDLIETDYQ